MDLILQEFTFIKIAFDIYFINSRLSNQLLSFNFFFMYRQGKGFCTKIY